MDGRRPGFRHRPSTGAFGPGQHLKGFQGRGLVNTWTGSDEPRGKLVSPPFAIDRDHVNFLIGGGRHPGETCINLKVDDKVVRTATGKDTDAMEWQSWDVRDLTGKSARIEIVDQNSGGWGHIDVDQIELADTPRVAQVPLAHRYDFGTLCLALLKPAETDRGLASIATAGTAEAVFGGELPARKPLGTKLTGALVSTLTLEPGQEAQRRHSPSPGISPTSRFPARDCRPAWDDITPPGSARPPTSPATSAGMRLRLDGQTRLGTTPGTIRPCPTGSSIAHLPIRRSWRPRPATGSGTAGSMAGRASAAARGRAPTSGTTPRPWRGSFPELERILREQVDYAAGVGFDPATGVISHRAEEPVGPAVDGQAGNILRAYREHQMSADSRVPQAASGPSSKASLEYLIRQTQRATACSRAPQHNTLDAEWFGEVPWLSSLYLGGAGRGRGDGPRDGRRRLRRASAGC